MAKKKATKKKAATKKKTTKKKSTRKSKATPKTRKPASKKKVSARAAARVEHDYEGWDGFTRLQRMALKALEHMPKPAIICRELPLSRGTFYRWTRENPTFAAAVEQACDIAVQNAEAIAIKLATEGSDELVISNGQVVMSPYDNQGNPYGLDESGEPIQKPVVRKSISEQMLKMILAAKRPEEYGRSRVEHTGKDGDPIQQENKLVILNEKATGELSQEMLEKAAAQAEAKD